MKKYIIILIALVAFTASSNAYYFSVSSTDGYKAKEYTGVWKKTIHLNLDAYGTSWNPYAKAIVYATPTVIMDTQINTKYEAQEAGYHTYDDYVYKIKIIAEPDINHQNGDSGFALAIAQW